MTNVKPVPHHDELDLRNMKQTVPKAWKGVIQSIQDTEDLTKAQAKDTVGELTMVHVGEQNMQMHRLHQIQILARKCVLDMEDHIVIRAKTGRRDHILLWERSVLKGEAFRTQIEENVMVVHIHLWILIEIEGKGYVGATTKNHLMAEALILLMVTSMKRVLKSIPHVHPSILTTEILE